MSITQDWLDATREEVGISGYRFLKIRPRYVCADGFSVSIQASRTHYCTPREDIGPYDKVELGYPSERVEALMPYIDGDPDGDEWETVYGCVPVDVVDAVIGAHGAAQ